MQFQSEEGFLVTIPNWRHVPFYNYDKANDDLENGWVIYHSKKYLRRKKKLLAKKRKEKEFLGQ